MSLSRLGSDLDFKDSSVPAAPKKPNFDVNLLKKQKEQVPENVRNKISS